MTSPQNSRFLVPAYLTFAGILCVAALAIPGARVPALAFGILCIPIAAYSLWQARSRERQEAEAERERERIAERTRSMADGFAIGMFVTDLRGSLLDTNQVFRDLLGYPEGALTGKTIDEFILPADRPTGSDFAAALASGRQDRYDVEKRFLNQNTQVVWVQLKASLLRDTSGSPSRIAVVAEDITDRKQAGTALQDGKQLFRLTFEQAAVGLAHTDADGRLMFVNQRLRSLLGKRREDLFGCDFLSLMHPDDAESSRLPLAKLMAGAALEYSGDQRYRRRDGAYFWGHLSMSLMRDPDGQPKYGVVMIEDITEQQRIQEELRESEARFRAITDTASDAIVTVDENSRILFVNPATAAIFGRATGDMVGHPLSTLLPTVLSVEGLTSVPAGLGALSATEVEGVHRNGSTLCLEVSLADSSRHQQRMFTGVIRNVTERKRAAEEQATLRAREQQARAMNEAAAVIRGVIDASPLPILTLDAEGNVSSWNEAATSTFGWTEEEVVGAPVPFAPARRRQ